MSDVLNRSDEVVTQAAWKQNLAQSLSRKATRSRLHSLYQEQAAHIWE